MSKHGMVRIERNRNNCRFCANHQESTCMHLVCFKANTTAPKFMAQSFF
jgi:hypothetical protein